MRSFEALVACGLVLGAVACGGKDASEIAPPTPPAPSSPGATPSGPGATSPGGTTPGGTTPAASGIACVGVLEGGGLVAFDPAAPAPQLAPLGTRPDGAGSMSSFGIVGRELLFCSDDGEVVRFDLDAKTTKGHGVECDAVTADATGVFVLSNERLLHFASPDALGTGTPAKTFALRDEPSAIGTSAGGVLAAGGFEGVVVLDRATGKTSQVTLGGGASAFGVSSLSERDGKTLVVSFGEGGVQVFDATGKLARTLFERESFEGIACAR